MADTATAGIRLRSLASHWSGSALASLAAWTAVAVVTAMLATTRFMVNDDVVMAGFASGQYTGDPSAHLVFIGILPGLLVSRLYRLTGSVPWYTVMLYVAGILSCSIVTRVSARHRRSLPLEVQFVGVVAVATWASILFVQPTFTVAAMSVTIAAVVLLADAAVRQRIDVRHTVVVATLLASSAALRLDAFLGGVAVTAPLLALCWQRIGLRRTAVVGLSTLAALIVVIGPNAFTSNDDWVAYEEFNEVRGTLHGTGGLGLTIRDRDSSAVQEMLDENGWSEADLLLFARFFIDDPAVYDVETLQRLSNVADGFEDGLSLAQTWDAVVHQHRPLIGLVLAGTAALALGGRRRAAFAAGQLVWTASLCLWVAHTQRFPTRVAAPLLIGATLVSCVAAVMVRGRERVPWSDRPGTTRFAVFAAAALVLVIEPLWPYSAPALSDANDQSRRRAVTNIDTLQQWDPDGTFVVVGGSIDISSAEATSAAGPFAWDGLLMTGWHSQSPSQQVRLRRSELEPAILPSTFDREHVWIVARRVDVDELVRVAQERYGLPARVEVGPAIGRAVVVRLVPREP